jgi:hypothetical protein
MSVQFIIFMSSVSRTNFLKGVGGGAGRGIEHDATEYIYTDRNPTPCSSFSYS